MKPQNEAIKVGFDSQKKKETKNLAFRNVTDPI
jgi:hypothetical protein